MPCAALPCGHVKVFGERHLNRAAFCCRKGPVASMLDKVYCLLLTFVVRRSSLGAEYPHDLRLLNVMWFT